MPEVGGSISVTMRASVDLPQPDSPTTASVLPGLDREGHAADRLQPRRLAEEAAPDSDRPASRSRASTTGALTRPSPRRRGDRARCARSRCGIAERVMAADLAVHPGAQLRAHPAGMLGRVGAARAEETALRTVVQAGHDAGNGREAMIADAALRQRREQRRRVGVLRRREQRGGLALLHDLAGIHHHDPLCGLGDDAHVVRDEHERHAALALQRQ